MAYVYDPRKAITIANYPLLANPRRYFYTQRQGPIRFGCIHITAGIDDYDGADGSAESSIRYGQTCTRPASWTGIVDSDTIQDCLPDHYVAFAQGVSGSPFSYNTHGIGLEIGKRTTDWREPATPAEWTEKTLRNAAIWWAPRVIRYGLQIRFVTLRELNADLAAGRPSGFIEHHEIDPRNRSDAGLHRGIETFPREQFLRYLREEVARLSGGESTLAEQKLINAAMSGTPGWRPITEDGIDGPETKQARERYMATLNDISKTSEAILKAVAGDGIGRARQKLVVGSLKDLVALVSMLAEKVAAGDDEILKAVARVQESLAAADVDEDDAPVVLEPQDA